MPTILTVPKARIKKIHPHMITDGLVMSQSAAIELDISKMNDYEYFYVNRAIAKGAIKVVQYEVVSENEEV
jgi:hypothetical protein